MISKLGNCLACVFAVLSCWYYFCHNDRAASHALEFAIFLAVMASNLKEK